MTICRLNWMTKVSLAAFACLTSSVSGQDYFSDGGARGAVLRQGRGSAGCPTGNCPTGQCRQGYPSCFGGMFQEHYCKNSPDHGYSPPAKYPLHRRGVQYNSYFPNQWYGTPGNQYGGGYPMVYHPTDTTQLGYYYQQVPFWQPNPNALPQRPIPASWHIVAPPVYASNFHGSGTGGQYFYGGGYGMNGYDNSPVMQSQEIPYQQSPGQSMPVQSAPLHEVPAPPPTAVPPAGLQPLPGPEVPPTPRQNDTSAADNIRRALY